MTDVTADDLRVELALAEEEDDWAQIDMADVLEHHEEAEITPEQMRKIVAANPDFHLGRTRFMLVHQEDKFYAVYTDKTESAIHITMGPDFVSIHETHPY